MKPICHGFIVIVCVALAGLSQPACRATRPAPSAAPLSPTAVAPPPPLPQNKPSLAERAARVRAEVYVVAPRFAEGPSWHENALVFSSGGLRRVEPKTRAVRLLLGGSTAGTYRLSGGRLLVCDNRRHALLLLTPQNKGKHRIAVLAERWQGRPLGILNDVTVDRAGNIYWTEPRRFDAKSHDGHIFRLTPEGKVSRIATGLSFPNGIEVDPASRFLYVVESPTGRLLRYGLPSPPSSKPLILPTVFYRYETQGDGLAFDAGGNLWATEFLGRAVVCLSPNGERLAKLAVPAQGVSNLTFGGSDGADLFVTTGSPNRVFRLPSIGVTGFSGHPGAMQYRALRYLR